MESTGIVRRVDRLGRIVIPKGVRDRMHLEPGSPLAFAVDGSSLVLLAERPACIFCGRQDQLRPHGGRFICAQCARAVAGPAEAAPQQDGTAAGL